METTLKKAPRSFIMLIPAAQYLTYAEAVGLYNQLRDAEITALVKSCGPPSLPFGEGLYYQLLIEEAQAAAAQEIVATFERQRLLSPPRKCPRCGSAEVGPVRRPAWWQRVFYAGTTLYACGKCGKEFAA